MVTLGNNLLPYGGELYYIPDVFTRKQSDTYFNQLFTEIRWKQEPIKIFGKEVLQPRLTAWYGDVEKPYAYSGISMTPDHWIHPLLEIKSVAEKYSGVESTSALLNLYRDGNDGLGWHRDNEKELGDTPVIGSVSFGSTRKFQFRNYKTKKDLKSVELTNGSFLLMRGRTNHFWEHQVPKTAQVVNERINITFRVIY